MEEKWEVHGESNGISRTSGYITMDGHTMFLSDVIKQIKSLESKLKVCREALEKIADGNCVMIKTCGEVAEKALTETGGE